VPERPHDAVNEQLELRRAHAKQAREAVVGDRVQQPEELEPVLGEVLKVGSDHAQGGLKHRRQHLRYASSQCAQVDIFEAGT
jgi:hypothetical protein